MSSFDSDSVGKHAGELFESGWYCAESVLLSIAEASGEQSHLIPRISTGLCGGVSRTCDTCGAVTGGVLGIGILLGRTSPDAEVEACYAAVQEFKKNFEAGYGSVNCEVITGCDLGTDAGQSKFKDSDQKKRCQAITANAAKLAMDAVNRRHPA